MMNENSPTTDLNGNEYLFKLAAYDAHNLSKGNEEERIKDAVKYQVLTSQTAFVGIVKHRGSKKATGEMESVQLEGHGGENLILGQVLKAKAKVQLYDEYDFGGGGNIVDECGEYNDDSDGWGNDSAEGMQTNSLPMQAAM